MCEGQTTQKVFSLYSSPFQTDPDIKQTVSIRVDDTVEANDAWMARRICAGHRINKDIFSLQSTSVIPSRPPSPEEQPHSIPAPASTRLSGSPSAAAQPFSIQLKDARYAPG